MPRSASHNDEKPEVALDTGAAKSKPTARKAASKGATPKATANGRKPGSVNGIASSMLDADFDSGADQNLSDSSSDMDVQGLDDMDAAERFDLGDAVKPKRSRSRG